MLTKLQRPFTDEERTGLLDQISAMREWASVKDTVLHFTASALLFGLCAWLVVTGFSSPGGPSAVWTVIILLASLTALLSFYFAMQTVGSHLHWSRHARRFARDDLPPIQAALSEGNADVLHVESEHAVVIEEYEDEGSAYLFDLGDGTSLFLRGQHYFPIDESAPWPAARFEIVRTATDGRWVGIFSASGTIESAIRVAMEDMPETFQNAEEPGTETVLPGNASSTLKDFGYASR